MASQSSRKSAARHDRDSDSSLSDGVTVTKYDIYFLSVVPEITVDEKGKRTLQEREHGKASFIFILGSLLFRFQPSVTAS
jgi:hypothetical protein